MIPSAKLVPEAGLQITVTMPSTASVATGCVYETTVEPLPLLATFVPVAGDVHTGRVVSWTVVQNRREQQAAAAGTQQASCTTAIPHSVALHAGVCVCVLLYQLSLPSQDNSPVTKKVAVAVLLLASLAVQATAVLPIANVLPEAGTHVTVALLTASVAVGSV